MKKAVLALMFIAVTATSAMAKNPISFLATVDVAGNIHASVGDYSSDESADTGVTIGAEYAINNQFGLGARYQLQRNDFNYIPVYGYAQYTMDNGLAFKGNLGYNLLQLKESEGLTVNGGIYVGGGASYAVNKNLSVFGEYNLNMGSVEANDVEVNMSYSSLAAGVKFNLD